MESSSNNPPTDVNDGLSPAVRWIASALIAFHVFAVFVNPFHFTTRLPIGSESPASAPLRSFIDPYIRFMYLNHGYAFFAPDPGPAHLIRYEVRFADGRKKPGQLPDLDKQWPRLLYHRHFMIAEALHSSFAPPTEPQLPAAPPDNAPLRDKREYRRIQDELRSVVEEWKIDRSIYEKFRNSLIAHIRAAHEADGEIEEIKLTRFEHLLPMANEYRDGVDGNADRFFIELPENPGPEPLPWNPATQSPTNK